MANRNGGFIGTDGLDAPDPPTAVTPTAGDAQVSVAFTAPTDTGTSAITGFVAQVSTSTGDYSAGSNTGTSSPIVVSSLTNGTAATAKVWAINAYGTSAPSDASASFTPAAPRGLYFGGYGSTHSDVIQYITISTTGNAQDFGDLTAARLKGGAAASSTRALTMGGQNSSSQDLNIIEYVTIATTGDSTDFGDLNITRTYNCALNSSTRAVTSAGGGGTGAGTSMEYVTIASTGNATDFGDPSGNLSQHCSFSSPTRGVLSGGRHGGSRVDVIEYITIASVGDVTDFGNLSTAKDGGLSGCSNATIGLTAGGESGSSSRVDDIEQITIASTGNATDFGNLLSAGKDGASSSCSSATRGIFWGLNPGSADNVIEYVTIGSAGNATDFGDLLAANRLSTGATSNTNGGNQ